MKLIKQILFCVLTALCLLSFAGCNLITEGLTERPVDTTADIIGGFVPVSPLFEETLEPELGKSFTLHFEGEEKGGYYVCEKVVMSRKGVGNFAIDFGNITESLVGIKDGAVSRDPKLYYTSRDMNFDGYADFSIQGYLADGGDIPHLCFLWNRDKDLYEYSGNIVDPVYDNENRKIYSIFGNDEKEYTLVYAFEKDKLVLKNSAEVNFDSEEKGAFLTVVNGERPIEADFVPQNLVNADGTAKGKNKPKLDATAQKALSAMLSEMKAAGLGASVQMAYIANGGDEHQTGLACDIHNMKTADVSFAESAEYIWLEENCAKFGFVLRYPENKTDITGMPFEPWHFRYVGRYHAERMTELGMCLEEYSEFLGVVGYEISPT